MPPSFPASSRPSRALLLAALGWLRTIAATLVAVILLAGSPLMVSRIEGIPHFTPWRVLEAFGNWLGGLGDGSAFAYVYRQTPWMLVDQAPRLLFVSFLNLALPGMIALASGAIGGAALSLRASRRLDRFLRFLAATPDFLIGLLLQVFVIYLLAPLGLRIRIGPSSLGLSLPGLLVMSVYPFCFAFRAASRASREALGQEWLASARARGLDEGSLRRRHAGAAVIEALRAELPLVVAIMQATLFIVEYQFGLPGVARFLFEAAFAGPRPGWFTHYQYNLGLFVLGSLVLVFAAIQGLLALALRFARRVLTGE